MEGNRGCEGRLAEEVKGAIEIRRVVDHAGSCRVWTDEQAATRFLQPTTPLFDSGLVIWVGAALLGPRCAGYDGPDGVKVVEMAGGYGALRPRSWWSRADVVAVVGGVGHDVHELLDVVDDAEEGEMGEDERAAVGTFNASHRPLRPRSPPLRTV